MVEMGEGTPALGVGQSRFSFALIPIVKPRMEEWICIFVFLNQ